MHRRRIHNLSSPESTSGSGSHRKQPSSPPLPPSDEAPIKNSLASLKVSMTVASPPANKVTVTNNGIEKTATDMLELLDTVNSYKKKVS